MKLRIIVPLTLVLGACPPPTDSGIDRDTGVDTDTDVDTDSDSDSDTDSDSDSDSDVDTDSDSDTDTARTACLTYPVPSAPQGRQDDVEAAVAVLDPEGSVTWNTPRDAPSRVAFDVGLSECTDDGANLYDAIWTVIEAHPDAFLIDRDDWADNPPAPCSIVAEGRTRTLQFRRELVGGVPVARDVFSAVLRRTEDGVRLQAIAGTYLPPASDALATDLMACPDLDEAEAETLAVAGTYDYTTFFNCTGTGTGTYSAQAGDTFSLTEDPVWSWYEADGQVLFEKTVGGQFLVDESRWTSDLLSSDAYCPGADDREATVGWRLTFDTVTGELLGVMPGIGCLVC